MENPTSGQTTSALMRRALAVTLTGLNQCRLFTPVSVTAFALLAAPAIHAQASTGTVSGQVMNLATGQYLPNAEVRIVGTDRVAITGAGGRYSFSGVPAGEIRVAVVYTGLDPIEQTVTVAGGETADVDFSLSTGRYGEVVELNKFVVSTAREGNARAISDQKFALNLKTVISSDTFGDVPEGNLGEFLKLLPGITVDFVEADVRNIRVRGLPPKYATITFDGHPIANSGSSDLSRLRALEMEQVSLATVETIEVNKSPTADMSSPGLGGNVNTVGKSAFSQKGRSFKYSVSTVMNDYHMTLGKDRGWDDKNRRHVFPNFSFEYMDTLMDGRLGIVAAISHSGSFMQQKIVNNSLGFNSNAADNDTELPTYTTIQLRDGPKPTWRDSAVLNVDFKVTPDLLFKLRTSYGDYDAQFFNKDFNFITNPTAASNPAAVTRTERSQSSQSPVANSANSRTTISSSNSRKTGTTTIFSPSLEWKKGDWTLEASGSYSKSINDYNTVEEGYFRTVTAEMRGVNWKYDLPGEKDFQLTQLPGFGGDTRSIYDLGNYNGTTLSVVGTDPRKAKGQIWSGRLDATYDLSRLTMPTTIKFGVMHRQDVYDVVQSYGTNFTVATSALNPLLPSSATNINLREFNENYPAYVNKGVTVTDITGTRRDWHPTIDNFRLFQFFKQYVTDMEGVTSPASGPFTPNIAANLRGKLQSEGDVDERQKSAYMMGTVKITPKITALGGVRFEKTTTAGKSFDDVGHARASAISGTTNTNDVNYIYSRFGSRITRTREYDNMLPSLQVRYAPTRRIVARAAYFKSLMRPDYSQLTGGVTVSGEVIEAPYSFTLKNIDLQPETADNFDLGFEYYFEPVGVVSVNFFYKKISDIQVANTLFIDPNNVPQDVLDLGFTPAMLGDLSTIATRINAGEASLRGMELSYSQELTFLPGVLRGLGVTANATFVDPSDKDIFLTSVAGGDGASEWSGNLILRYNYKRFKAQLATTFTKDTARAVTGVTYLADGTRVVAGAGARYNYTAARTVFGLNLDYRLTKYASVFLNVSNLTNEPQTRYEVRPLNIQRDGDYGTTFNLGVKGRF
jgi:iron complex outermembrane receptor protein